MKSITILVLMIFGTTFATDQAVPASKQRRILWCAPNINKLVGLTVDQAAHYLARNDVIENDTRIILVRPVEVDGQTMSVTEDIRMDRVNVVVEGTTITAVNVG